MSEYQELMSKVSCLRSFHLYTKHPLAVEQVSFVPQFLSRQNRLSTFEIGSFDAVTPNPQSRPSLLPLEHLILKSSCAKIFQPSHLVVLNNHVDLEILRILSLHRANLIASVLGNLEGRTPSLKVLRLSVESRDSHYKRLLSVRQLTTIQNFLSGTRLQEIGLYNFFQDVPWTDMLTASGPTLLQLTQHMTTRQMTTRRMTTLELSGNSNAVIEQASRSSYPSIKQHRGTSNTELHDFNAAFPQIERLGVDFCRLSDVQSQTALLDTLANFRQLRHLHIFSPYDDDDSPKTNSAVVGVFDYLNQRKKGTPLETLLFIHQCDLDTNVGDRCQLWQMADGRVLLSHRYNRTGLDVKEMYDGEKCLWTKRRSCQKEVEGDEWKFPA